MYLINFLHLNFFGCHLQVNVQSSPNQHTHPYHATREAIFALHSGSTSATIVQGKMVLLPVAWLAEQSKIPEKALWNQIFKKYCRSIFVSPSFILGIKAGLATNWEIHKADLGYLIGQLTRQSNISTNSKNSLLISPTVYLNFFKFILISP